MTKRATVIVCIAVSTTAGAVRADDTGSVAPTMQAPTAEASTSATKPEARVNRDPKRWHVGLEVGALAPRGDLDAGLLIGAVGTFAITANETWRAQVTADWVRTGRNGASELTPAPFPRSRTNLDEGTDLVTIAGGGSVRVATFGTVELRAGLLAGLQVARARFEAYAMSQVEHGVSPAGMLEISVGGRAGAFGWRAIIGWREAHRDLGDAASYGEEVTSGAVIAGSADW